MRNKIAIIVISIIASVYVSGCATRVTLVPAQPATTNEVTGVVTPAVPGIYTNIPNQTVTSSVGYGTQALPFIPQPYNGIVGGVLTLLALGAGAAAAYKNKQLNTANAVVATVVTGVEAAGSIAAAVKQAISKQALADGTADAVHAAVSENVESVSTKVGS